MGVENNSFGSEIGSGFGVPGGKPANPHQDFSGVLPPPPSEK